MLVGTNVYDGILTYLVDKINFCLLDQVLFNYEYSYENIANFKKGVSFVDRYCQNLVATITSSFGYFCMF